MMSPTLYGSANVPITKTLYKFYVRQRTDITYYKVMRAWLDSNCTKNWQWYSSIDSIVFWDEQDAIAFKLKFHEFIE